MNTPYQWTIQNGAYQKFQKGSPWLYLSDLADYPKGTPPGAVVELLDNRGQFLAYGHGNLMSQISFKKLSQFKSEQIDKNWLVAKMISAYHYRSSLNLTQQSFRWIFAEADGLPGLVVDYFLSPDSIALISFQVSSAGMEQLIGSGEEIFKQVLKNLKLDESKHILIRKNNSSSRIEEGLLVEEAQIIFSCVEVNKIQNFPFLIKDKIVLRADLLSGQKTGFFLDQSWNLALAKNFLTGKEVKVLDLFTYIGQWGIFLGHNLKQLGTNPTIDFVDSSQSALEFCGQNAGELNHEIHKVDIIHKAEMIPNGPYDIIVCDPPALIKKKKDFQAGRRAYEKSNRESLKRIKDNGLFITCSCSHHLSEEDLMAVVSEAAQLERKKIILLAKGQQGHDHPVVIGFHQGFYLKALFFKVQSI